MKKSTVLILAMGVVWQLAAACSGRGTGIGGEDDSASAAADVEALGADSVGDTLATPGDLFGETTMDAGVDQAGNPDHFVLPDIAGTDTALPDGVESETMDGTLVGDEGEQPLDLILGPDGVLPGDAQASDLLDADIQLEELPCQPFCQGLECGDDGCGGSCGQCVPGMVCVAGFCTPPPCKTVGQLVSDDGPSCCPGLVSVPHCHAEEYEADESECVGWCPCGGEQCKCDVAPGEEGNQIPPLTPFQNCSGCVLRICAACGDGECGPAENRANCPYDCGHIKCYNYWCDYDSDGIPNLEDNCEWIFNPSQKNSEGD